MTSGSKSEGTGYPSAGGYSSKAWVGSDGRTEVVHGRTRIKYNNYTMDCTRESVLIPSVPLVFVSAGVAPSAGSYLPWTNAMEFQLQSKLVERIKGHEFNLAVNLAQSKQLVDMCVLNIRKFGLSLRYLKRGDFSAAARQLGIKRPKRSKLDSKDISGRWLELQYGWLPSISDAYEAAKAYEAFTSMRKIRVSATLGYGRSYEGSAAPSNYSCPGYARTSKKIIYEMEESLSLPRSLGLMDPFSVVWEIIPYSFVFDWFLPIGSYLENLAVIPNLRGRFISTTNLSYSAAFAVAKNPMYAGRRRTFTQKGIRRVCSTGLNTQRPQFNSPVVALSAKRIFNAIALAHQRLI